MEGNLSVPKKEKNVPMERQLLNRVPEVTIFFWIIKILVTTLGERAEGFLKNNLNFGFMYTAIVMCILLMTALYFQFKAKKYVALNYWLVVVLISVVGTLGSDILDVTRNIKVAILIFLLAVSVVVWYYSERTLSIHSINTTRREVFYWLVILLAFALGKAAGDWISGLLRLNYISSVLMYISVIGIVTLAHRDYKLNSIFAFWITFILTSPLGKTLSAVLSKPIHSGGIGLGTAGTNLVFLLVMVILMICLKLTNKRKEERGLEDVYQKLRQNHTTLK